MRGSRSLIAATRGRIAFTSRSCLVPNVLARMVSSIRYTSSLLISYRERYRCGDGGGSAAQQRAPVLARDEIEGSDARHQPQRVLEVGGHQQRFQRKNSLRGRSDLRQGRGAGFGGRNREQNHGPQQAHPGVGSRGLRNVLARDVARYSRHAQQRRQRRENDSSESHVYLDFTMLSSE